MVEQQKGDPPTTEESWHDSNFLFFQENNTPKKSPQAAVPSYTTRTSTTTTNTSNRHTTNQSLTSVTEIPPWMDLPIFPPNNNETNKLIYVPPPLIKLHNEIVEFAALMSPQPEEVTERENFIVMVRELIEETFGVGNCMIQVFGSQSTGLWLPTSDVDIVVQIPEEEGATAGEDTATSSSEKKKKTNGTKNTTTTNPRSKIPTTNTNTNNEKNPLPTPPPIQNNTKVLQQKEQDEMKNYNIHDVSSNQTPLARIAQALQTKWSDHLSYLELIENTRIPIVKFTHAPTNLSCDICFNQKNGPLAADLVTRFLDAMPPLKPLTFVLKYFMASRGLNEPYSGGVGSFMLQMMIVSFLQHRERDMFNAQQRDQSPQRGYNYSNNNNLHNAAQEKQMASQHTNLGALLLEFFQLYGGGQLNYVTTGISVRNDGFYFPKGSKERREDFWQPARPFSLAMENPLEIGSDVGKPSFRMQNIAKAFEASYNVLMSHVSDPAVPTASVLASILPPTEEMRKRAMLLKVTRIEGQLMSQGYSLTGGLTDGVGGGDGSSTTNAIDMSGGVDGELKSQRGGVKKKRRKAWEGRCVLILWIA